MCSEKKKKNSTKRRPFWQKVLTTHTPFVCQHQHQHTIKHKTRRTNTHERLIEYNNSERVSLTSMLVRHPCMALVPNFTLAFPPSELSFSFTGCERYAPMSFTSFTSSSPKCLQLFPENDRDRCVVRTPINAHFLKPRVCPTRAT